MDGLLNKQKDELNVAVCQGRSHVAARLPPLHKEQVESLKATQEKETESNLQFILQTLDEKVTEQQTTLEKVGVPGFFVTKNPSDVKVQMYLIHLIIKVGDLSLKF